MVKLIINENEYYGEVFLNDDIIDNLCDFEHYFNKNNKCGVLNHFKFTISGFVIESLDCVIEGRPDHVEYQIVFDKKIIKGIAHVIEAGTDKKTSEFESNGTPEILDC